MTPHANRFPIWDAPLRLFHWALVGAVTTALVSGFLLPAWWLGLHLAAGYGVSGLLAFRLIWGWLGSEFSRFDRFDPRPGAVWGHLTHVAAGRANRHAGHNPAGAAMIVALLVVLVSLALSGVIALGGQEKQGALAAVTPFAVGDAARRVHEILAVLLLALVALHVAGVIVESRLSGDNLARAMIDGRKRLDGDPGPRRPARTRAAAALTTMLLLIGGSGWMVGAAQPPLGLPDVPAPSAYQAECGACHHAFHPSLLPAKSWRAVMADLGDHFGDDAGLKPDLARALEDYLVAHAAETWDSEAANRLRITDPAEPGRITATPFWRATHRALPAERFAAQSVGGKVNCPACHRDAASGRFADQAIRLPN